jgi:hypothetical protein
MTVLWKNGQIRGMEVQIQTLTNLVAWIYPKLTRVSAYDFPDKEKVVEITSLYQAQKNTINHYIYAEMEIITRAGESSGRDQSLGHVVWIFFLHFRLLIHGLCECLVPQKQLSRCYNKSSF